jgi:DNA primase
MASIPEEIIDRVRTEANIVDVISDYVRLRKTGKNWLGLCPFHDDKKPSFNVEPVRGIYKCFACGKGGNVFTFLMELNGWTFPESVRNLATTLGIDIPDDPRDQADYSENERLASAVRDAARFYYQTLRSDAGITAQAYFRKRGFSDETLRKFGLGYAPDEWESLMTKLTDVGYTTSELDRAGLIIKREGRSGWYDRFRGRAMFPIFTGTGRLVGFGARRMNEDPDQPKYINSPESPIYQKSRVLYGLFQAKDAIRKSGVALFVEGYADVISLHQAGIETAIATCGTAMAPQHAELIARYCSRVVLVFDSDKAGQSATERGIDVLLRQGLDVSVLRLPDGEDPDTFVQKFGQKEFERRINESVSFLEFRARTLKTAGDFDSPERSAEAIRSIVGTIAQIPDTLKRELYTQKIAAEYHISETLLLHELERAIGRQNRPRRELASKLPPVPAKVEDVPAGEAAGDVGSVGSDRSAGSAGSDMIGPIDPRIAEEVAKAEAERSAEPPQPQELRRPVTRAELPAAEVALLGVLVQGDPQMLEHVFGRVTPDDFGHPFTRELGWLILAHYQRGRPFSIDNLIMEDLTPELRDLVTLLAIERESISDNWSKFDPEIAEPNPWKVAQNCLVAISYDRLEREYRSAQDRLRDPDLDEDSQRQLLVRFKEIGDEMRELKAMLPRNYWGAMAA